MIIQVRGAPGSGKSWVIRQVMSHVANGNWKESPSWEPDTIDTRKNPTYYKFYRYGRERRTLFVLGQYENSEAGIDSLGSVNFVYNLMDEIEQTTPGKHHFLMEGHFLSQDVVVTQDFPASTRVVFLTSDKPDQAVDLARIKLTEADILCRRAPVEQAVRLIMEWIK